MDDDYDPYEMLVGLSRSVENSTTLMLDVLEHIRQQDLKIHHMSSQLASLRGRIAGLERS